MVLRLVREIRKALDCDLYFVALTSALTLPDICGKVAYPAEKNSKIRYIQWFDEEIGKYEKDAKGTDDLPYLSGELIYSLRCSLVHEGNPNISNDKLKSSAPIDHFSLIFQKANLWGYVGGSTVTTSNFSDKAYRTYGANVRSICMILCNVAESYYLEYKDKFHFDYEVIDWDETTAHLPHVDMERMGEELVKNASEICRGNEEKSQ